MHRRTLKHGTRRYRAKHEEQSHDFVHGRQKRGFGRLQLQVGEVQLGGVAGVGDGVELLRGKPVPCHFRSRDRRQQPGNAKLAFVSGPSYYEAMALTIKNQVLFVPLNSPGLSKSYCLKS